jgi:hypothetical protein
MAVIPAFGGSGDQEDDGLSMASGKKNKTLSEIQLKQKIPKKPGVWLK